MDGVPETDAAPADAAPKSETPPTPQAAAPKASAVAVAKPQTTPRTTPKSNTKPATPPSPPAASRQAVAEEEEAVTPLSASLFSEKPIAPHARPQAAQTPTAPPTAPDQDVELSLIFDGDSWVEVEDASKKKILSRSFNKGAEQRVVGTPPLELTFGRSRNVRLIYQGVEVDPKIYQQPGNGGVTFTIK
jgi:cytoskeleton protein RodZ